MQKITLFIIVMLLCIAPVHQHIAQETYRTAPYDIGNPTVLDFYINPATGDDANDGTSPETAFRSVTMAWRQIPMNETLTIGYRLNLAEGRYTEELLPNYWESRYGTYEHPIIIQGAGMNFSWLTAYVNVYDVRYIYFLDLSIWVTMGDVFHCEFCDHLLIRDVDLSGAGADSYDTQETLKVNQSQHIYIENSGISGAWDNALDFVAVQYGHILNNRIQNAGDWCAYVKGGSAYIRIEGNVFNFCATGGFSAGQGTGFQFMTPPWIGYEAYFIEVVNNTFFAIRGAGVGVQGGYNVVVAYNTFFEVGENSHLLEVVYGHRSCDGQVGDEGRERCADYLAQGGWGTTVVDDGTNYVRIPNKNVFIYNNVLWGVSQYQHFTIHAPYSGTSQAGSGLPDVVFADENLHIRGNLIWDKEVGHYVGVGDGEGCLDDNPTCNLAQITSDNTINQFMPDLYDPFQGMFWRIPDGNVCDAPTYDIPPYPVDDLPEGIPTWRPHNLPKLCAGLWD